MVISEALMNIATIPAGSKNAVVGKCGKRSEMVGDAIKKAWKD